jgi:probable F420-dependent oxidoreductase
MKFTLDIPLGVITPGEFQSLDAVRAMAQALEAGGIDACYLTDHPAPDAQWLHAHGHDALDPFTAFGVVAALTTRLRMHTNILVLPYRNPFLTAKAAATLQMLSGGRLILGVGGGYQPGEFEALGIAFGRRGKLFDEALEVIRRAWAGGAVAYEGMGFRAAGNEPRPIPDPAPPIWIGGGSDKAVERAAQWGDGWSPFFAAPTNSKINQESGIQSVAQLGEKIARLNALRAEQGRTGPFDIAIGPRVPARFGTRDCADQMIAALHELAAVGVTWAMIGPPHPSRAAYIEHVRWFAEDVIARMR